MRILVTGGAGFIGSHLVDFLSKKHDVVVFDNLVEGHLEFLENAKYTFIRGDLREPEDVERAVKDVDVIYHFAADPDVKKSAFQPIKNFNINVVGTLNLLEAARRHDVKEFVFASSSTVYGIAEMPTPETAPLEPISNYGASKAAGEMYVMSYAHSYGFKAVILRFANIIGPRLTHGVIYDFYRKLKKNPRELEILGDGTQKKAYMHVLDAVRASVFAAENSRKQVDYFNVGAEEQLQVTEIADIIVRELGLSGVKYRFTGGKGGWVGDVPVMLLSMKKLHELGFKEEHDIRKAVVDAVHWLQKNEWVIKHV